MKFNGRRPRDLNFVVCIALQECFRSHFAYCFRCILYQVYIPEVAKCSSRFAVYVNGHPRIPNHIERKRDIILCQNREFTRIGQSEM